MSWLARCDALQQRITRWQFKRSIRRVARADARAAFDQTLRTFDQTRHTKRESQVRRTARLLAEDREGEQRVVLPAKYPGRIPRALVREVVREARLREEAKARRAEESR